MLPQLCRKRCRRLAVAWLRIFARESPERISVGPRHRCGHFRVEFTHRQNRGRLEPENRDLSLPSS